METEVGFQSRALMWGQMPRVLGGVASPKHPSRMNAQVPIGIQSGFNGCLSCLRDRQDNLGEHLKSCWHGFGFIGVGCEADQEVEVSMLGSMASRVIRISQDCLRVCYGM